MTQTQVLKPSTCRRCGKTLAGEDPSPYRHLQGRITELDPTGATLWSIGGKNFGPRALAFDGGANVIAVGEFSHPIDLAKSGPILGTTATNAFIAKFSPDAADGHR